MGVIGVCHLLLPSSNMSLAPSPLPPPGRPPKTPEGGGEGGRGGQVPPNSCCKHCAAVELLQQLIPPVRCDLRGRKGCQNRPRLEARRSVTNCPGGQRTGVICCTGLSFAFIQHCPALGLLQELIRTLRYGLRARKGCQKRPRLEAQRLSQTAPAARLPG